MSVISGFSVVVEVVMSVLEARPERERKRKRVAKGCARMSIEPRVDRLLVVCARLYVHMSVHV